MPKGSASQTIVFVILGLLLAFFLGWIIWKAIKTPLMKKKAKAQEIQKDKETRHLFYDYVLSFNEIIIYNRNQLKKFVVSIGDIKMNQIREGSRALIQKLLNRSDFGPNFAGNEQYKTFVSNCELLGLTNSNLWDSKIPEVIEYFKTQADAVPESDRKNDYIKMVKESIERQFYEK
ncbi:hypothetical protein JN00_0487 [Metamycoplasma subdolum]|uniref:Uncharacterized protein n=1 Tax=Metamycoplasma subdolum TaxID=92407 RepID=A0A3M0A467_9BACT|nr:hypothetical protein [Metamycoplasma subdolum]RMA77528.1 hypothetical protein JN00_0487 [Metamycoplasma subdolum]WPB50721.1 hypothetical protein R9C05_01050 [Metamycoplasma subdolum]